MEQKHITRLFKSALSEMKNCPVNRVLIAVFLFDFLDRLRLNKFPGNWFNLLEKEFKQLVNSLQNSRNINEVIDFSLNSSKYMQTDIQLKTVQKKTGDVYYHLWKEFMKKDLYFDPIAIFNIPKYVKYSSFCTFFCLSRTLVLINSL